MNKAKKVTLIEGDGIVTTDLFGDILSDLAAGLTGDWARPVLPTSERAAAPFSRRFTEQHPTAAIGADFISVIDPGTFKVRNITVGQGPHGIRAGRHSRWLYVTVTGENQVAVIDTRSMQLSKKIPVGGLPFRVAVNGNP